MAKAMKVITAVVLYAVFSLSAVVSGVCGLLGAVARRDVRYLSNVMHSQDMLLAALFGWNGRATVSKECGRELARGNPCRFCRVVCKVLSVIYEPKHCEREAER